MKKLLTLVLSLILAMGALGLVACGGKGESITKEEFIAELARREAVSLADETLRYETVDCTYVEHTEREISADGTYGITYGDNYAYVRVEYEQAHGVQQRVFGVSAGLLANMPEEILSATKFVKDGDNLEMSYDATMEGVKFTGKCVFDKNGYVIYSLESQSGDGFSGSAEFTVKKYNKAAEGTQDNETVVRFEFVSVEPESYTEYFNDSYVELSGENGIKLLVNHSDYIGTYTLDGNTMSITAYYNNGSTPTMIKPTGVIDGDVLTITFSDGTVVVYNRTAE